jgi:SAM-dependent methyltransferase
VDSGVDSEVGERARQGRKFGPAARDYERGRPGYPAAAIDTAAQRLGLGPGATVLDLAAGTGKLTRQLTIRFARVIAVEPQPELREIAAASAPTAEVRDGTAERLPLAGGEVDAVFVAEAFHWFDGPAALAEAARVLRPGGGIALLWNTPAGPTRPPLPAPARELARAAVSRGGEPGGPLLERAEWRRAFDGAAFGELHDAQFEHEFVRDRAGLIANVMSVSSVAGLPATERETLRDQLRQLVPEADYRQPLRTDLSCAGLLPVRWCARCGEATTASGAHPACEAALALEPPRFCRHCRRRMVVQVLPAGWSARCVAHGELRAGGVPQPRSASDG